MQPKSLKRNSRQRSWSDDPNETLFAHKRVLINLDLTLKFAGKSMSTPYFSRPFQVNNIIQFSIPSEQEMDLKNSKSILVPCSRPQFEVEYKKLLEPIEMMMEQKPLQKKGEKKTGLEEKKLQNLFCYFEQSIFDINFLAETVKLPKSKVKRSLEKYQEEKSIFKDLRGKKALLNDVQCNFIKEYFANPKNFDKTVLDLHRAISKELEKDEVKISYWTLYDYMHKLSFSHTKIIYKTSNANTPKVKDKRVDVALKILGAHYRSFDFIYIDETSFNLQTWALKGWSSVGTNPKASKPVKSNNYSAITAMDIKGVLGVKIVRGGVKAADFFIFIKELIGSDRIRFARMKTILFMDNAKIHVSKDYMQKFEKFYNVLYNAPYSPQLNPIEFAFSKLKNIVRKSRPKTEKELINNILRACNEITEKDAAGYIVHSLKFLPKAVDKEDFF